MDPDNNPTLYNEIISELEEMPDIKILYACAEDIFKDTRHVASIISDRKTIVVQNEKYTNMDSTKKHTENPLDEIVDYLSKNGSIASNIIEKHRLIDTLREQDDGYHKVSIYHAEQPEDAETLIIHLFKTH